MKTRLGLRLLFLALWSLSGFAHGQGTAISCQGQLNPADPSATGLHDFTFKVVDLEIGGRTNGGDVFTSLPPRQAVAPPYAIFAGSAGNEANRTVTANPLKTGGLAPTPGQFQRNVGIGTTTPGAKLHAETNQASTAAVYGKATGGGGGGVSGQGTPGAALHSEGNATQARGKAGFVKAMLFVEADGRISRCYNGVTGSSVNGCGFSVLIERIADFFGYYVTFPFQVSDRFASVTTENSGDAYTVANIRYDENGIYVRIIVTDQDWRQGNAHAPFTLIVY